MIDNILNFLYALWYKIRPPVFLTEDQIKEDLKKKLSNEDKQYLLSFPYEKLIRFHLTAGMDIRNNYHLWDRNNPYTKGSENHPDDVSFRIIQQLWKDLQTQ